MAAISDINLLSYPVLFLNKVGLCNHTNTAMETIILTVIILGCMLILSMSSLQYLYMGSDINEYVGNLECSFGFIQILGKVLCLVIQKHSFLKLISISKSLWKIDMCAKEQQLKLDGTYRTVLRFQKIFIITVITCVLVIFCGIFFGLPLPTGVWKMDNSPKLYIFYKYAMNFIFLPASTALCFSDLLFISICYTIIIQFRILCHKLGTLNFDQSKSHEDLMDQHKQLYKYIEYHKFLLSYLSNMQNVFSNIFGIQYITSAPLACAEIYTLWDSRELPPLIFIRNIGSTIYVCFQLAFYCIPADLVIQEGITVANAVYNCNWYSSSSNELKKSLQIVIRASQPEHQFTAWGMVDFKPATVLSVLKVAVSASTIFRQLENK